MPTTVGSDPFNEGSFRMSGGQEMMRTTVRTRNSLRAISVLVLRVSKHVRKVKHFARLRAGKSRTPPRASPHNPNASAHTRGFITTQSDVTASL